MDFDFEKMNRTMNAAPIEGIDKCFTVEEVAQHLNISVSSLKKIMKKGYLPYTKLGHQDRIMESDLVSFLKQIKNKTISF